MSVNVSRVILVVICVGGGLAACTTQEVNPTGIGGGGGAQTGLGGSGGGYATDDGTLCPLPANALIADFTNMVADGGTADGGTAAMFAHFGDATTLGGGEYIYPDSGKYLITSDVAQNAWHISGNIGTYSGFGLYFDNCTHVDASAYGGISFKISGSVAQGDTITMTIGTLADVIPSSWLDAGHGGDGTVKPGRCIPASGATTQYDQSTCVNATKVVPVTDTPTTQAIMWDQFSGGKPEMSVTASDIVTIAWAFPAPPGAGGDNPTTYAADIVIDDLAFIPR